MAMSPRLLRPRATGFTPKNISGLVAWFDADDASTFTLSGTSVQQWRDKSGNNYSVSQGTANNQPSRTGTLRGRACIDFDGANDFLAATGSGLGTVFAGDKEWAMFIVGEMHDSAESTVNALGTWVTFGVASGNAATYIRSTSDTGQAQFVQSNDAGTNSGTVFVSNSGPAGAFSANAIRDFFICSMQTGGGVASTWRTHTIMAALGTRSPFTPIQGSSISGAVRSGNFSYTRFTIGCYNSGYQGDFFPARIAEVILYNRRPTDSERASLVTFLSKKYNNVAVPVL